LTTWHDVSSIDGLIWQPLIAFWKVKFWHLALGSHRLCSSHIVYEYLYINFASFFTLKLLIFMLSNATRSSIDTPFWQPIHTNYISSFNFYLQIFITVMRVSKISTLFLILIILLLSSMQDSYSISRSDNHVNLESRSTEKKISSMFVQSYSAILSSLNSRKSKLKQIHAVSRRLVPSGPNPLHNWSYIHGSRWHAYK